MSTAAVAVAVLSVILSSHLGGGHRHVNLLPVQRERANDPHGNRDVPTNDLAVRTEDALIVVALLNYATHDTTQRSRKIHRFKFGRLTFLRV